MMASLMRRSLAVFAVIILAMECGASIRSHRMLFGRRHDGLLPKDELARMQPRSGIMGSTTFKQVLDHFSPNDPVFWDQRYYFNKQYVTTPGVNFLFIGGEGEESGGFINSEFSPIVQYAKEFGAALYDLEHRFYGQSKPTANHTLKDLQYLTSQQALEDLAYFIKYMNQNEDGPQRWVVFGGSYPGSLALWFRQKYPDLAVGGVGSSGPVLAQLDFYGYLKVVEDDIKKYDAKNPEKAFKCADQIAAAHDAIQKLMQTDEGRKKLDDQFKVKPPLAENVMNANNIALFYQSVQGIFMEAAQYNGAAYMAHLCDIMTDTLGQDDAVARLRKTQLYPGEPADSVTDVNYDEFVNQISNETWNRQASDTRSWLWQTCNEFGYYQSTDTGSNIFRSTVPVNMFLNICADVYKMQPRDVQGAIDNTNDFFGARDYYTGTNVVAPYGTYDPWHFLAKQKSVHHSVVIYEMKDATHCRDMQQARGEQDILEVQQLIRQNIDRWLNGPPNPDKKVKITDKVGQRPEIVPFNPGPLNFYSEKQSKSRLAQAAALKRQQYPSRLARSLTGRHNHFGLLPPTIENEESTAPGSVRWPPNLKEGTVSQPFDHFNSTVPFTFQQRFWYNRHFGCPTCPNFLMIGGEGPESNRWVTNENYAWMTYAESVGANAFLLEHRYYGKSKLRTTDLKYLTSAQMLFDVAEFIEQAKLGLGLTGPWITFGGSYSGALAAWSREWFPELIAGAVGSSGPVQAKVDFYEYLQVVEKTLQESSTNCLDRTAKAFTEVEKQTTTPQGRKQLTDKFNLLPAWTAEQASVAPESVQNVMTNLYGVFQGVVQYSDDNNALGVYNVSTLCNYMTADVQKPALDALLDVVKWQLGEKFNISSDPKKDNKKLKDLIQYIDGHDPQISDNDLAGLLWTWQTCNEFGYYQSTDSGTSTFGSVTPVNLFIQMCEDVFNIDMAAVSTSVDQINYQYGGRDLYKGTNVILPNGRHDPWHALGLLDSNDKTVMPILIDGTAHCADMYPARDSDLDSLKQARIKILAGIKNILGGAPPNPGDSTASPASAATTQPGGGTEVTTAGTTTAAASILALATVSIIALLL